MAPEVRAREPRRPLPETDLRRIQTWCEAMWPPKFADEVRAEHHVRGKNVTICETRAPWDGEGGWTHQPVAQLRYRPDHGDWTLHWADRSSRWHEYREGGRFTGTAAELLAEIDADPTSIFWG